MTMKTQHLQAMFARRRETEHMRVERTEAVSRYFDHWGKVTTRFENWTTPEYYKQAEQQLQETKQKREKEKQLAERRKRLAQLLSSERMLYEQEVRQLEKRRPRRMTASTRTLEKIDENLKEREAIRRRLELEAKLYGKWRHGVNDENLVFESKSDHEVLAKLNWLEKQVEEQLQREKDEASAQERRLRLQEEMNRAEQVQKERQQIREQEIREIRALQERHMDELKKRQAESDSLKLDEKAMREHLAELEKELQLLEESSALVLEPADLAQAYNFKKIKVFIRKRSELYRNQIKLCLSILERVLAYASKPDQFAATLAKYKDQLEAEKDGLSQIEAMYESEAKCSLQRCEEAWQAEHMERYHELKRLLRAEAGMLAAGLKDNLQRQEDVIEMRSTHLNAIESSNEKLKQLIKEAEDSPRPEPQAEAPPPTTDNASPRYVAAASSLPQLTDSFNNLNLDVWQKLPSARGGIDSPRLSSQRSLQVVTPDTAERPKFGRKRIAWT